MDQLKSIKKHRIGRRLKHVEKYEQKMKEERQKRIRERQKEFFSEIEVHRCVLCVFLTRMLLYDLFCIKYFLLSIFDMLPDNCFKGEVGRHV